MSTPDGTDWRSIFSILLRDSEPEVGGREDLPDELRARLELLARGKFTAQDKAKEIEDICEVIVRSPGALAFLARLLKESEDLQDQAPKP